MLHTSATTPPATTAYSGTSRLLDSPPTGIGIRAGTAASVKRASAHGLRMKSRPRPAATAAATTPPASSHGLAPEGVRIGIRRAIARPMAPRPASLARQG
jgi:hypothetical protein